MSPVALPSQNAVVLYGPKDLRFEERTLWPPSYNQAQVSVVATGLCGSDCESTFPPMLSLSLDHFQCITTYMGGTVTLLFKLHSC
jgi:hypothetical protein